MQINLKTNVCLVFLLISLVKSKCDITENFGKDIYIKTFKEKGTFFNVGYPDFLVNEFSVDESTSFYELTYFPQVDGILFKKKSKNTDATTVELGDYVRYFERISPINLGMTEIMENGLNIKQILARINKEDNIKKIFELAPFVHENLNPITMYQEYLSHKEVINTFRSLTEMPEDEALFKFPNIEEKFEAYLNDSHKNKLLIIRPLIKELTMNIIVPLYLKYVEEGSELETHVKACLQILAKELLVTIDWFKDYTPELSIEKVVKLVNDYTQNEMENNLIMKTFEQQIHSEDKKMTVIFPQLVPAEEENYESSEPQEMVQNFTLEDEDMKKTVKSMMTSFRRLIYMKHGKSKKYTMPDNLMGEIVEVLVKFQDKLFEFEFEEFHNSYFSKAYNVLAGRIFKNFNPQRLEVGFWLEFNNDEFENFFLNYTQITSERENFREMFMDDMGQIPINNVNAFLSYNYPEFYLDHENNNIRYVRFIDSVKTKKKKLLV